MYLLASGVFRERARVHEESSLAAWLSERSTSGMWNRSCRPANVSVYRLPTPTPFRGVIWSSPALSVSNSSSGRRWKLDHAPAVGDPTHMVEFGTGRRAFAREA